MQEAFRRAANAAPRAVAGVVLLASLAACSSLSQQPPQFCPRLGLMEGAGELTRFQGSGRDITDITLSGKIDAVPATCSQGDDTHVDSELSIKGTYTRGTAAKGRDAVVTYVVTVLNGDTIIDQRDLPQQISFPAGVDRASFASPPIKLALPVPAQGKPNYRVFVGFRLTADELAFNRAHNAR